MPRAMTLLRNTIAGSALIFGALAVATPANAGEGSQLDSATGHICLTPQCDTLQTTDGTNVACVKVWPNNDRRQKPQLRCRKK